MPRESVDFHDQGRPAAGGSGRRRWSGPRCLLSQGDTHHVYAAAAALVGPSTRDTRARAAASAPRSNGAASGRNCPLNRAHAKIRARGERAIASLKTWKLLVKMRCCPRRATAPSPTSRSHSASSATVRCSPASPGAARMSRWTRRPVLVRQPRPPAPAENSRAAPVRVLERRPGVAVLLRYAHPIEELRPCGQRIRALGQVHAGRTGVDVAQHVPPEV
jgi:hypothetical protein